LILKTKANNRRDHRSPVICCLSNLLYLPQLLDKDMPSCDCRLDTRRSLHCREREGIPLISSVAFSIICYSQLDNMCTFRKRTEHQTINAHSIALVASKHLAGHEIGLPSSDCHHGCLASPSGQTQYNAVICFL